MFRYNSHSDSHSHPISIPESAASSTEGSSSSSALSSLKGAAKKKKQVNPGGGGNTAVAMAPSSDVVASKPKATQSKKSKGCQTSGGPFPYKAPPAAAATAAVGGIQKNVKVGGTKLFLYTEIRYVVNARSLA